MTIKEAIKILKAIYFLDEKKQKALDIVIEALEDIIERNIFIKFNSKS